MIRQLNEKANIGDFIQLGDNPAIYLKVIGGSHPAYQGVLSNDPSKWIGNDELYKGQGAGLVNIAQRDMGPYRIEGDIPQDAEAWLEQNNYEIVDGKVVTKQ